MKEFIVDNKYVMAAIKQPDGSIVTKKLRDVTNEDCKKYNIPMPVKSEPKVVLVKSEPKIDPVKSEPKIDKVEEKPKYTKSPEKGE